MSRSSRDPALRPKTASTEIALPVSAATGSSRRNAPNAPGLNFVPTTSPWPSSMIVNFRLPTP
jgi:hypothetical protein